MWRMMFIDRKKYADKVKACWIGKNIGGTMGTPYEGCRTTLDIKGFATEKGEVLPNDDLDLQLVWLLALERCGANQINSALLGEYWLGFITPHWNEYGIGKGNMRRGIMPPFSGDYENNWKDSNGAWIRTEIWACTLPGAPNCAANLAIEDAKVDHGCGEGTLAAAFVAAMQSAAFVLDDARDCIEVGLASSPENSRVAKSVKLVMDCYDSGKTWLEARNAVFESNADLGDGWFEAPSNVAYAVLGMIYGEGDFKKAMILAINCGDDTDCTAATLGATLGILGGMDAIPKDWMEYIGDGIVTISISEGGEIRNWVPTTCSQLTDRVINITPACLLAKKSWVSLGDKEKFPADVKGRLLEKVRNDVYPYVQSMRPYSVQFSNILVEATATLSKPNIEPNDEITIDLQLRQRTECEDELRHASLRWILPEGFSVSGGKRNMTIRRYDSHNNGISSTSFVLKSGEQINEINRIVCEILITGRHTPLYVSIPLLAK